MTFALPFLLALGVGAVGITRQAWRDEHATWSAATIPWSDLIDRLSRMDIVLAPYYIFMRGWVAIAGDSVVALRLPSLVAMATAAGLTGVLGARLYNPWVGLTAGSLLAVVPSISRYAEEARPYAFALCFAVATVLALVARRWILLAVFVTLTGWAHLIALTVLLAHLPLLLRPRTPTDAAAAQGGGSAVAQVGGGAVVEGGGSAVLQGGGGAVAQGGGGEAVVAAQGGGGAVAGVGDLRSDGGARDWVWWLVAVGAGVVLVVPLGLLGLGQTGQVGWIDASWRSLGTLPVSLARSATVAGILGALGLLGIVAGRVDRVWALLVLWVAAPPLVVFVVVPQFFYYRYLLFTLPAWALLAALGAYGAVRELSRRRQTVAAVALCAAVLLLGARDHAAVRRSPLAGDQDYRGAAGYLAAHMSVGDSVYFAGYSDKRERNGFAYELRAGRALTVCEELATCQGRVWQVTNARRETPAGFTELDAQAFQGIQLRLLRRD